MATSAAASYGLGWLPELPDQRDFMYAVPLTLMKSIPEALDLRAKCPPVYDQGALGSCTANALAAAYEFNLKKQNKPDFMPSRLFIYYNERVLIHTVNSDSGAYLRDGIKTLNKEGVCPEKGWPYDIAKFATKPSKKCYTDAQKNQILTYQKLNNSSLSLLQGCLAEGFPFVFGFTVYDSFLSEAVAKTGIMPMPGVKESVQGGHAVMAVGYDNAKQVFLVRNSWNTTWGIKGYFYMPYAYITSMLCSDFWTIRTIE